MVLVFLQGWLELCFTTFGFADLEVPPTGCEDIFIVSLLVEKLKRPSLSDFKTSTPFWGSGGGGGNTWTF